MEILRCNAIGFLKNLQNDTILVICVVDEKKMEKEEVSTENPIPKPMSIK